MGLDFGTAFSKVVVRAPYLHGKPAYAVRFDGLADASSPYLLPTSLFIGGDGVFSLDSKGIRLPHDDKQPDIKYGLMTGVADMDANGRNIPYADACAAYLAMVICRAKVAFMREYGQNFAGYLPKWEFINIGIPAATKSDNDRRRAFQHAANAALALADSGREITADSAAEAIKRAGDNDDRCLLMPEVAAQIQGYKKSDVRRYGLHIMADAGASTLDVCSFIINKFPDGDRGDIAVFCAEVSKLGANILKRKIAEMPACGDARKVEDNFWRECERVVRRVVSETKRNKAPNEECWQRTRDKMDNKNPPDALPFLLCGGGAAMDGYKNLPVAAERGLLTGMERFDKDRQMPVPGNLLPKNLPKTIYHRLSVAYGLSFGLLDDGVPLPSDIPPNNENDSLPEPAWKNNYIGKEQT